MKNIEILKENNDFAGHNKVSILKPIIQRLAYEARSFLNSLHKSSFHAIGGGDGMTKS